MSISASERVLRRSVAALNGCIVFTGHLNNSGYGMVSVRNGTRKGQMMLAHREVYMEVVGPIPAGMVLDHLCGTRACVNHLHLQPVTQLENVSRGEAGRKDPTLCRAGLHRWTGYQYQSGGCPECKVTAERERRKRHGITY